MEGFKSPEMIALPESATIPGTKLISPPPNQFTHVLVQRAVYHFAMPNAESADDGEFEKGTQVLLVRHESGAHCYVADAQGLYVALEFSALQRIV
jgi:hypothetical protein